MPDIAIGGTALLRDARKDGGRVAERGLVADARTAATYALRTKDGNVKLILSRKGFDSSFGGHPSPILPDGRMVSLPIPSEPSEKRGEPPDPQTLGGLHVDEINLGQLAADLTDGEVNGSTHVHRDPDIDGGLVSRPPNWRPALGQTGASQTHLHRQGVGPGDIFLFYGWFRRVEVVGGRHRYKRGEGGEDVHVIFGWLQVEEIWPNLPTRRDELLATHPEQADHPHIATPVRYSNRRNTLYVAAQHVSLPGQADAGIPGAGVFRTYSTSLRLTKPERSRRQWQLPTWMWPSEGKTPLSFHPHNPSKPAWSQHEDHVELKSAAPGQEFVLDCEQYPESVPWIAGLLGHAR